VDNSGFLPIPLCGAHALQLCSQINGPLLCSQAIVLLLLEGNGKIPQLRHELLFLDLQKMSEYQGLRSSPIDSMEFQSRVN
jgi:hypothetical protein